MRHVTTDLDEPTTDQQAAHLIEQAWKLHIEMQDIETSHDRLIAKIERRKNKLIRPVRKKLFIILNMLFRYLEIHRERLLRDKKKISFDTGESWWKIIPSVAYRSEKALIKRLEKMQFHDCVQVDKKVKKKMVFEKLLQNIKIHGARINRREELYVRPTPAPGDFHFKRSDVPQMEFTFMKH